MEFSGPELVDRINMIIDTKGLRRDPDLYNIAPSGTLSAWKNKGQIPKVNTICSVADFLGVSVKWLITGDDEEGISPEILEIARKITALSPQDREEIMLVINHKLGRYPETNGEAFLTKDPPPAYGHEPVQKPEIKVIRPSKFDNNVVSISYDIVYLPFYGQVAAGKPISFDIVPGMVVPWDKKMTKGDPSRHYTVQIKGNSMTEANIEDGDYVMLRHTNAPQHNRIMLIRHGNDSTLKRIKMKGDQEVFMAWEDGSGRIERLDDQEYEIQGEFMGILRG